MSKIICDVCGTKYPDTMDTCPICGYSQAAEPVQTPDPVPAEDMDMEYEARPKVRGGRFSKSNVRKRNQNNPVYEEEPVSPEPEVEYADETFEEPVKEKSSTALNVLLVAVILVLLVLTGYIFSTIFLPRILEIGDQGTEPTVQTDPIETEAPTLPPVPCTGLEFADHSSEDVIILEGVGQMYLLNVMAQPADTTDIMTYQSSDESVITVNEEGRVTAVGEGAAVVTIFCGDIKLECQVVCSVVEDETEAPTEEPTEAPTEPGVQKTVTNSFVNIRSGAGTEHEKVGEYKKGDVVTIYEEKMAGGRKWGRTDDGWICMDYVK